MDTDCSGGGTIDLKALLAELPACKHCRSRRRRCDTKLPSCDNCAKVGKECVYFDHVLNEELPRNYISSLIEHLEVLSEPEDSVPASTLGQVKPEAPDINAPQTQHGFFGFAQGSYRYLGAKSFLSSLNLPNGGSENPPSARPRSNIPAQLAGRDANIPPALHGHLVRLFFNSIHLVYPILDPTATWLSPDAIMGLAAHPTQAFILQMVYAIACRCDYDNHPQLLPLASAAHERALQLLDKTTAEQSTATLQMAIMLVLYTMLDPSSGNISQQLGFATRLAIDLAASDSEEESSILSTLHKAVYCLENSFCVVLDRPSSLPEPLVALDLSVEEPLDFLCTLHIIQSRIRRNLWDASLSSLVFNLRDEKETLQTLHPNILSALWETRLMLKPSAAVATKLSSALAKEGHVSTFLTPYWVHKCARIVVGEVSSPQGSPRLDLIAAYGNAAALFGGFSSRWNSANILMKDVQSSLGNNSRACSNNWRRQ